MEELSQAVNRLQAQPLPQNLSNLPERSNASEYLAISTPSIDLYTEPPYPALESNPNLDASLELLSRTINSLEAEIEDKLFAIWQGIAIRQVEDDFWGHPVPLDLIHEMGFSSMQMADFLEFVGNLNDPTLEFVPSSKHNNYVIRGLSAWYITFRA
jgi:hypothetical protein